MGAFVELTAESGHKFLVETENIVAIEPLLADPDKKTILRLNVSSMNYDPKTKRYIMGPYSYTVFGTPEEIQKKIEDAQDAAHKRLYGTMSG